MVRADQQHEQTAQQQQQSTRQRRGSRGGHADAIDGDGSGGGGGGGGGGGEMVLQSGALSSIHASHLNHIRTLQRANAALSKKVEYLHALQSDSTKIKLVAKQQRLLREKQLMVDELAEIIMSRGAMTAEALAAHLQALIERGALDQPNPAQLKKELMESRKEQSKMATELARARKQIRALESGTGGSGGAIVGTNPLSSGGGGGSARGQNHHAREAQTSQLEAERASHAQISAEYLTLTSAHTHLQSAHHALQLSLAEHKKLVATVTEENRTLRSYLSQWEASEERRILAEQNVLLLQESSARTIGEREALFQELRAFRTKLLALAAAKTAAEQRAMEAVSKAKQGEHDARAHAATLLRQLDLLKNDLRSSGDIIAWHRGQNLLHLTAAPGSGSTEETSLAKERGEEIARLQKLLEASSQKVALLLQKEGQEEPQHRAASYALLVENDALRRGAELLESRVGEMLSRSDLDARGLAAAVEGRKQAEGELAVLQVALQQMAQDLQRTQQDLSERTSALRHLSDTKLPKMRAQRESLALACQRQNEAIRELARQVEEAQAQAQARGGEVPAASTPRERRESRSRKHGASSSHKHASASASAVDISSPAPARPSSSARVPSSSSSAQRPASAHASSKSARGADRDYPDERRGDRQHERTHDHDHARDMDERPAVAGADAHSPFASIVVPVTAAATAAAGTVDSDPTAEWCDPSGTWSRYATEDGQAWYYYNATTGESVWTDPLLLAQSDGAHDYSDHAAAAAGADDPFDWHSGGGGQVDSGTATATSAESASSAGKDTARSDVRASDLELTPLPSARLWDDMPQLSARHTGGGAAAAAAGGRSAGGPSSARQSPIAEDGADGDEFAVDAPSESEPPTMRSQGDRERAADQGYFASEAVEDEFGVPEEEF